MSLRFSGSNTSIAAITAMALVASIAAPVTVSAGTLVAQIKDRNGNPVPNAVIYAIPVGIAAPSAPPNATAIVEQQMFKFEPFVSVVQTGTRMRFPNKDRSEHHLKVLSGPSAFEFKVYTRKEPEPTRVDKSGLLTLQCLIHDWMSAHIYVVDSPWFGKTGRTGSTVVEGVPAGDYDVYVTHPSVLIPGQITPPVPRRVRMDANNVQVIEAKLELVPKSEPTKRYPPPNYE